MSVFSLGRDSRDTEQRRPRAQPAAELGALALQAAPPDELLVEDGLHVARVAVYRDHGALEAEGHACRVQVHNAVAQARSLRAVVARRGVAGRGDVPSVQVLHGDLLDHGQGGPAGGEIAGADIGRSLDGLHGLLGQGDGGEGGARHAEERLGLHPVRQTGRGSSGGGL